MARQITTQSTEGMPMWDSFEASFFVGAGLSVGIVLGFLFPSLWRTFRRRFRKTSNYTPDKKHFNPKLTTKLKILHDDVDKFEAAKNFNTTLNNYEHSYYIQLSEAFVLARNYFQINQPQEAIKLYVDILTHQHVSKIETNRALFELSQVYASIGLYIRAFETAFELLRRTPNNLDLMDHVLTICSSGFFPKQLEIALNIFKNTNNIAFRLKIAHAICQIGEFQLSEIDKIEKTIEFSRNALRWERHSGRAMILLWQATSSALQQNSSQEPELLWTAFAANLEGLCQIFKNNDISPAAGAPYLAHQIIKLSETKEAVNRLKTVENEFFKVLNWDKIEINIQKFLWASIFHASLLLQKSPELKKSEFLNDVLAILGGSQSSFDFVNQQNEATRIGYFAHHCKNCNSFFSSFAWNCKYCNSLETLKPIIMPNFEHS
ncbi:hypothetical protein [Spirobacillus cienkowskii]|uniref:tetratricopeptide repeat protein n=1 Tax=Spirobacillus cienkowskii TaxID=495820 RepID=UPI0030CD91A7